MCSSCIEQYASDINQSRHDGGGATCCRCRHAVFRVWRCCEPMLLIQADKQMTKPPATVPKMCLLAMAGGALVLVCYISIFKASPLIMLIAQQTRVVFARESDRSIP